MTTKTINVNNTNYNILIDGDASSPKSIFVTDVYDNIIAYLGEEEIASESIDALDAKSLMSYIEKQTVIGGGDVRNASSGVIFNLEGTYVTYNTDIQNNFSILDSHIVLEPNHSLIIYGGVKLQYKKESIDFDGSFGAIADVMIPCTADFRGSIDALVITDPKVTYETKLEKLDTPVNLYIPIAVSSEDNIFHGVMMVALSPEMKDFYREFSSSIRDKSDKDESDMQQETESGEVDQEESMELHTPYVALRNLDELLDGGYTAIPRTEG